jgi:hypothetical protein
MTALDLEHLLASEPCWDRSLESDLEQHGEATRDAILQNRDELIGLCRFIERARIRSYLEIGIWTGRLVRTLHRIFRFDLVAACDHGWARQCGLQIQVPPETELLEEGSDSEAFLSWRASLGPIDLVLIDANHAYHAVRRDLEINQRFPHRFIALHDICGARRSTRGVKRLWDELDHGHSLEIVRPQTELGLDHSLMGIGIWSATEDPATFDPAAADPAAAPPDGPEIPCPSAESPREEADDHQL